MLKIITTFRENRVLEDPYTEFMSMNCMERCYFLYQQSVVVNYIEFIYSSNDLPFLQEYKSKLRLWMTLTNAYDASHLEQTFCDKTKVFVFWMLNGADTSNLPLLQDEAISLGENLYSHLSLKSKEKVWHYDLLINRFDKAYIDFLYCSTNNSASDKKYEMVNLPSLYYTGDVIYISNDSLSTHYLYNQKLVNELNDLANCGTKNFMSFLLCFDMKDFKFKQIVGWIASLTIELDINAFSNNSSMMSFLKLYSLVYGWKSHLDKYRHLSALSSQDNLGRCLIYFTYLIRKHYKVKFDDASLLARILSNMSGNVDSKVKEFLEANKASDISIEQLNAFDSSILSEFDELRINNRLAKNSILNRSTIYSKSNADENQEDEKDTIVEKPDEDQEAPSADVPEELEEESSEPDDDSIQPDEEPKADDVTNQDDQNSDTHTQHTPEEDLPMVSDFKGVKLELSKAETLDTVLFRREFNAFLTRILANPKNLSATRLKALQAVKTYWLNILSVKSLCDVVNIIIKTPKTFNK